MTRTMNLKELSQISGGAGPTPKQLKAILAWDRGKQNADKRKRYEKLWGNLDSRVVPYLVGPRPSPIDL